MRSTAPSVSVVQFAANSLELIGAAVTAYGLFFAYGRTAGWPGRLRARRARHGGLSQITYDPSPWPLPSVTESDAEALVAQPVVITVNRDIRSGPRDG